jgi:hypothetical protein
VLSIAALVAIVHLVASAIGGYWFDEVYKLAIGRHHLDWGSADQPPVAPLLAALMDAVAPGSIVALRLPGPYFSEVRQVVDGGPDATVWLCTGRREPWASLWPRLRTLTVV